MLDLRVKVTGDRLRKDVINLGAKVEKLKAIIDQELAVTEKSLVHADYFVNQVLVNDHNEISAVLDISYHAVVGNKRLDAASVFSLRECQTTTKPLSRTTVNKVVKHPTPKLTAPSVATAP